MVNNIGNTSNSNFHDTAQNIYNKAKVMSSSIKTSAYSIANNSYVKESLCLAAIIGIPSFILYNYNTEIFHPSLNFQSQNLSFSFDIPIKGCDIIVVTATTFIASIAYAFKGSPNF